MWLIGATVWLLDVPWVQLSISAGNGWPHNALRHHWLMPISCHFRDCKALLVTSLTHINGAIASVQTFTFLPLRRYYFSISGNNNNSGSCCQETPTMQSLMLVPRFHAATRRCSLIFMKFQHCCRYVQLCCR